MNAREGKIGVMDVARFDTEPGRKAARRANDFIRTRCADDGVCESRQRRT